MDSTKQERGVITDDKTLGHASVACARSGDLEIALLIVRTMQAKGMNTLNVYNLILVAIVKGKTGARISSQDRCVGIYSLSG